MKYLTKTIQRKGWGGTEVEDVREEGNAAASGNKPQKLTSEEEKTLCLPLLSPNFFERRKSNKVTLTSIYYKVCNMYGCTVCNSSHGGGKGMFLYHFRIELT